MGIRGWGNWRGGFEIGGWVVMVGVNGEGVGVNERKEDLGMEGRVVVEMLGGVL